MCAIDDGERFDFMTDPEMRTARKAHECGECRRSIQPGERYETVCGKYEGRFDAYKTCAHCIAARSWLTEVCNGHLFGGVEEDLAAHWCEGSAYTSWWLGRAIVGMRRYWKRKDGTLMRVLPLYVEREAA